ncbi:MAG: beta galactosidase jelly roll domain-containing protein, partial [Anaerovoracaceae bacterium]
MEFRDFQIERAENIKTQFGARDVIVYPAGHSKVVPRPDAMRIFFHLDNADYQRRKAKGFTDPPPTYPGFRWMLISSVEEHVRIVDKVEDADVIVYAAARKDQEAAKRIAAAVRGGTPLYVAAVIADEEIADLLPAQVKPREENTYPQRERVRAVKAGDPLFKGLSEEVKFGIYHDLTLKSGGTVRLEYSSGMPLVVEGHAGKGKVVYTSLGFGVDLIPGMNAYDALLLRTLSELTGKKLPESRRETKREDGWLPGASEENAGRVGIMLGDGLLCSTISNTLTVSNASGQYEFCERLAPKLSIPNWRIRSVSGSPAETEKGIEWNYRYGQIGVVELTAKIDIPGQWHDTPLCFQVEGGIDDTAKIYFNDNFLGEVTQDMPDYWKRPHRYNIPEKIIHYDKPNTIRILSENLRASGGFGSCPEITPRQKEKQVWDVHIDRANPLGKGGTVSAAAHNLKWRYDTSLAFPGIRWEFPGENIHFSLSNIASYAVFFRNGKMETLDLGKLDSIPCENWDKPGLLLFPKNSGTPMLLVFSRRQDKISVNRFGSEVGGLTIERKGGIGMLTPIWLYGKQAVNTERWPESIPQETLERFNFWLTKAFAFPVSYCESFKIDEAAKRVRIRSRYQFKDTENDWNIKPPRYAPVSPLAFFMKGKLFEGEEVENWKIATAFGFYAAKDNSDTVEWSLVLPENSLPLVPRIKGHDKIRETANEIFKQGSRFIGGGRPNSTANFVHTFMPPDVGLNIGLHMWLHGVPDTMSAPLDLDGQNRAILVDRVRYRLFLPIEQYAYKSVAVWREEPFTGIRYANCYSSNRLHHTNFASGKGTNFHICDGNESVYMITATARAAADQQGQCGLIRANATWFRHITKMLFMGDDWITLTGHCGESGGAASIDMLNCEYAGMLNVARIAQIAGDKEWQ